VDWLPHQLIGYQADQAHQLAAIVLLAGLLMSATAQRALSWRPAVALGHRSFAIYLLHFPILFSAGAFAFASLREPYGFWAAFGAAGLATIIPTLFLAALFTRYVDAPSNTLSHLASKRLDKYALPLWNRITTAFVGKIWRHVPHGRAS
jgi:peptidoglycan/LPS O-acetylase OafA/YrhL